MKKILAILLCFVMLMSVVALAACGEPDDSGSTTTPSISGGSSSTNLANEIVLWGSSGDQSFLTTWANKWVEDYNSTNGTSYTIRLAIAEEGEAGSTVVTSAEDAADVFHFADDQLDNLVGAGALVQLSSTLATSLAEANNAASILSATYSADGNMYGFPVSSDNANVLYYNTDYITPDADGNISLEDIMDIAATNSKKVGYNIGDAWYEGGLFATFGGTANTTSTNYTDAAITAEVANVVCNLMSNPSWSGVLLDSAPSTAVASLVDGTSIAQVAYPALWSDAGLDDYDNIAVAKMPTVEAIDGTVTQIKSFYGSKLIGVNAATLSSDSAKQTACLYLANYLSSYEVQVAKAEARGTGPSNIEAAKCEAALANPVIQAVAAQGAYGIPQISLPGGYWDAVLGFTTAVYDSTATTPAYSVVEGKVVLNTEQIAVLAAIMLETMALVTV